MALWNFEIIPDYFVNCLELERQSPGHKVATQPDFGLAFSQTGDTKPWHLFVDHVAQLNREGGETRAYKIIFLSRHGLGYHNVQEAKVGTEAWDVSEVEPEPQHTANRCRTTGPSSMATAL